ncbi:MAG: DUF4194 domain-containing protein [Spirochaetales bacterium]|nr:DUF4194 domain-containing protein [Spirochaetales bacterium]
MNRVYDRDFATVIIRLLKGPLYEEEPVWNTLISQQKNIADYLSRIGLKVNLHDEDGFAYLSHEEPGEDEEDIPRLIRRIPLSFEVSLLCVILREELERFDVENTESRKLFLTMREIRERITFYFKEKTDETRLIRQLERYIRQVEKLGFLKEVQERNDYMNKEPVFEVMRILKARVSPDFITEFKRKMEEYQHDLGPENHL